MDRFMRYLKQELDVDYMSAIHGICIVLVHGFLTYLTGVKEVPFLMIFQMFVTAYLIAWTQKLLFIKEKLYGRWEYRIRTVLWCILPNVEYFLAARVFGWYKGIENWVEPVLYLAMLVYYIFVLWTIRIFYQAQSREMNRLLKEYREGK